MVQPCFRRPADAAAAAGGHDPLSAHVLSRNVRTDKSMSAKQPTPPPPPPGITVRDVYYVLFRHKWLIISLSVLALVAALSIRFAWPVPYESQASLLIKWVETSRPVGQVSPDVKFTTLDDRGANIINAEVAILTSADV